MDHLPRNIRALAQLPARISRLQDTIELLDRRFPNTAVQVSSANGEVAVSVDHRGRLLALQLASGSTARLTHEALEHLINDTLLAAVTSTQRERRSA